MGGSDETNDLFFPLRKNIVYREVWTVHLRVASFFSLFG